MDAILTGPDGAPRIVEVDEDQHFSPHRAKAFTLYPAHISVAFDRETWIERSLSGMKPKGGNFAKPCPPLFPEAGGRHIQRAFRDALADLLPTAHGWAPTLRVGEFEVAGWLHDDDAADRMSALLDRKVVSR
ncbi:hypothetical protein [Cryobacterium sp. CG_9.6]|uniref:hypothetical protein n=1 Tax=Cryobacterium sp. CG_9.6 TaxID=2760710 RepID=UPI002473A8B1|nr:hypothetical protein [Cryobacterium sp. CG_9.6]MDH6238205.1 hypothetical protein [Cryobacterium sp. CG_9.6]